MDLERHTLFGQDTLSSAVQPGGGHETVVKGYSPPSGHRQGKAILMYYILLYLYFSYGRGEQFRNIEKKWENAGSISRKKRPS